MVELSKTQVEDLIGLKKHCEELGADLVVIGAIAFQVHFPEETRHTGDIDFAVALDLNEFAELETRLKTGGWVRTVNREHRWRSANGTLLDLIPAGDKGRRLIKNTADEIKSGRRIGYELQLVANHVNAPLT